MYAGLVSLFLYYTIEIVSSECSLKAIKKLQADFQKCSREEYSKENECQKVKRIREICGQLWSRCYSSKEVQRMGDLHMEAMVRQYGRDGELEDCQVVKNYR